MHQTHSQPVFVMKLYYNYIYTYIPYICLFVVIQSLSHILFFMTPMDCMQHAVQSSTISRSSLKFMPIESVMLSYHLICCPGLLLPSVFSSIRVFSNELALLVRWPVLAWIGASASVSVIPINIQCWFPLGLTGLIHMCVYMYIHMYIFIYMLVWSPYINIYIYIYIHTHTFIYILCLYVNFIYNENNNIRSKSYMKCSTIIN